MKVSFPAMRGQIGQRTYYSCMMHLSVIPKMFTFRDWVEFRPEDREQRILVTKRVPGIAKYMLDNEDGYLFSSITASYKCNVTFEPIKEGSDLGTLEMDFDQANFVINDGQHRCAAIAHALKENPELGEETISVLLFNYESRERVQQMFSDLNRFVVKTSKSRTGCHRRCWRSCAPIGGWPGRKNGRSPAARRPSRSMSRYCTRPAVRQPSQPVWPST